jgi:hypothetical protein
VRLVRAKNKHPVGYLKEQPPRLRPADQTEVWGCFSMPGTTLHFIPIVFVAVLVFCG